MSIPFDGLSTPLSPEAAAELRKNVAAQSRVRAEIEFRKLGDELDRSVEAVQEASSRLAVAQSQEEATRTELDSLSRPNYLQTLFYAFCAAAALACEFALSYQTLPPLLGLPMDGWLALAVGAAPVAAAVAIEMMLGHLLDALHRGRSAASRWMSVAATATLGLATLGVLLLNAEMVFKVANAREEASRLMVILGEYADTEIVINQGVVTAAILIVSFVVVINAAILLHSVMRDLHSMALRLQSAGRLRGIRRVVEHVKARLHQAKAAYATAQRAWDRREELSNAIAEAFRSKAEFRIRRLLEQSEPEARSLDDLIGQVLVSSNVPADVLRFSRNKQPVSIN
jgi:hypothetical protein